MIAIDAILAEENSIKKFLWKLIFRWIFMDFHVKLDLNNIIKADRESVEPWETRVKIGSIEVGLQFVGIGPIFVDSLSGCMRLLSVVRQRCVWIIVLLKQESHCILHSQWNYTNRFITNVNLCCEKVNYFRTSYTFRRSFLFIFSRQLIFLL